MPKIIIDQYTDRTDLTKSQKFALRNPVYNTERQRKWREANPEKISEINRRHRQKSRGKKIHSEKSNLFGFEGRAKMLEIKRLIARGKPLASICVLTGVPMSVITQIANDSLPRLTHSLSRLRSEKTGDLDRPRVTMSPRGQPAANRLPEQGDADVANQQMEDPNRSPVTPGPNSEVSSKPEAWRNRQDTAP
jgi:hypothetical protein